MRSFKKGWENLHSIAIFMSDEEKKECYQRDLRKYRVDSGYCVQNKGNCETCSLVNYGLDCHNQQIDN